MTVYVLIREDQNHYGYIDAAVLGIFRRRTDAERSLKSARADAHDEGLRLCDDDQQDPEWQVYWKIEEHAVE